jgi:hypothetical protein
MPLWRKTKQLNEKQQKQSFSIWVPGISVRR